MTPVKTEDKRPRWLKVAGIGLFVFFIIIAGVFSFTATRQFVNNWEITELIKSPTFSSKDPTPNPTSNLDTTVDSVIEEDPATGNDFLPPAEWEGADRVTILVMGLDYRDWETGEGAPRTDTMILLTIDPLSKTAGMLSIPRDLYVAIPGFQYQRINVAYRFGEVYDLPGGGPGLAVRTVEQLLGVPIDYYAQIDFFAFVQIIDEIGGLKVDVQETIEVDPIGPGIHKILQPGRQTLPGNVALAYARARNTEGGDFDRAQRQQQVILAIRERISHFDLIHKLISKAPILYQQLSSGINTDMSLDQALRLLWLGKDIQIEDIKRGIIGTEHIIFHTSPEGDQVLKPLPDKIRLVRDEVFGTANLTSPMADLLPEERAQAENANLAIYNGTFTPQLASRTAEYLSELGLSIPEENVGNADQSYPYTTVIDYTGNPYTTQLLVDTLGIAYNRILLQYDSASTIDVVVSLGEDWAATNTLP